MPEYVFDFEALGSAHVKAPTEERAVAALRGMLAYRLADPSGACLVSVDGGALGDDPEAKVGEITLFVRPESVDKENIVYEDGE